MWDEPWSRIERRLEPFGECWRWTGPTQQGYAKIAIHHINFQAHRIAYEHFKGPIPEGKILDHQCHNRDQTCPGGITCPHRACCNPDHLEAITRTEHTRRGKTVNAINTAKTHCKRGHPFNAENTHVASGTRRCRSCRVCKRLHDARRRAKKKAAA